MIPNRLPDPVSLHLVNPDTGHPIQTWLFEAQRSVRIGRAEGNDVVKATAMFLRAALALQGNDRATATTTLHKIVDDDGLPQVYRDAATVRVTALEFDQLKPEQVIARLEPMTKPGEPWYGTAGEMTAMALLKQGKKAEAGRLFAAVAADKQVPETIRSRAVQIAGTLGVDASASLPAAIAQ